MDNDFFNGGGYDYYGKPPEYHASFKDEVKSFFTKNREIIALCTGLGAAICLYLLFAGFYSAVLSRSETLYNMYNSTGISSMLLQMFYSIGCVAVPFGVMYFILTKAKVTTAEIPFNRPRSWGESGFLIIAAVGLCMLSNVLTSYLITFAQSAGVSFKSYYSTVDMQSSYPTDPLSVVLNFFRIAIVPAFCEELAFRGCLMQPLRKYGDAFAVVCSGVMFGLIHGNFTQAPFAIVAGILLGLICVYTGSIWPGMILHFLNNSISAVESYIVYNIDRTDAILVQMLIIYGLAAIGILSLVGYILWKKRFPRMYKNTKENVRNKWAIFFLSPTVLIPVLFIFYKLYKDIIFI